MKLRRKRTVKILAVLLPAVLMILLVSYGTVGGVNDSLRIRDFYLEDPGSLDVVILGASELYSDFSAGMAYKEFGFTSYPYAVSQNHIDLFPSQLTEIFKTQTPDVVVLDINGMLYDEGVRAYDITLRRYVEGMPFSWNKVRTIRDFGQEGQLLSYHLPFVMYHGNMDLRSFVSRYQSQFFTITRGYSLLKGNVSFLTELESKEVRDVSADTSELPLTPEAESKMIALLESCREQEDTTFVFTNFPHVIDSEESYDRFRKANYAGKILNRYGYELINFEKRFAEIGLDPYQDFYDTEHMNIWGQQKFTKYFGQLLVEEYDIRPNALSEKSRENWEQTAEYTDLFYLYSQQQKQNGSREMLWESRRTTRALDALKAAGH